MSGQDEVVILRARVVELKAELDEANRSIAKLLEINKRAVEAAEQAAALAERKLKGPIRGLQKRLDDMARQVELLNAQKDNTVKMLEVAMSLLTHTDLPFDKPLVEVVDEFSAAVRSGEINLRDSKSLLLAHVKPELRVALETVRTYSEAMTRSSMAQEGALRKLANDPKQAAKAEAFKLWQQWHQGKIQHRSGAAFARYVIENLPTITSTKVVERWATGWQRNAAKK